MSERMYRRELNHSYLVLQSSGSDIAASYAYRMMQRNRIGRLLTCSLRQMDGESYLYYDITSRQPLERLYEGRRLGIAELERIIRGIAEMQEELGRYLLDAQGLLLDIDTIFANVETEDLYFCFDPGPVETTDRYGGLADYLLEHIDHAEEHAVNVAYQFYKLSKAAYFVVSSFLPFLDREAAAYKREKGGSREAVWKEPAYAGAEAFPEAAVQQAAGTGNRPVLAARQPGFYDLGEEEEEISSGEASGQEKSEKKAGLFSRLWSRLRKRREVLEDRQEPWQDTILDSYLSQTELTGSGETVYLADLEQLPEQKGGMPVLQEEDGEKQYILDPLPVTVGKLSDRAGIVLPDRSVSRVHACFESGASGVCVRDLNSRNGTIINGRKLQPNEAVLLHHGDRIQFGRERFRYGLKRI